MPYKFKDDGSHIIKPLQRKLYLIIGLILIVRPVISVIQFHSIDYIDVVWGIGGLVTIWGVKFNGFYKLARLYAEWKLRKDNKFDYYSK